MALLSICLASLANATACLACNDIGCNGGFAWVAGPEGDQPLAPGSYRFEIVLEDDTYEIDCEVATTYAESSCEFPVHIEGETDYAILFYLGRLNPTNPAMSDPVTRVDFFAVDTSGSDPSGTPSVNRGPTRVSISVSLDDAPLTAVDYELDYARDENYRGDPACGFCDEQLERIHEW